MKRNKIQNGAIGFVLSVCLLLGLTVSYRVWASERDKKEKSVSVEKEEASVSEEVMTSVKADFNQNVIESYLEKTVVEDNVESVLKVELTEEERKEKAKKDAKKKEEEIRAAEKKEAEKKAALKKEKEKKKDKKTNNAFSVKMSDTDLSNLYRLVQSEVGYMDEKSKLLVASVVLNRVNNKKFPNTVSGVVLQKIGRVYQFSPVAPGKTFWTCTVSEHTKKAVDKVLKNGDYSKGALYFVAKRYTTKGAWFDNNLKWLMKHEGQDYYKDF